MNIRGKDIYVETYGSKENPALLYLHGGPGESCYDFSAHQPERLQDDFYLIAIDQRGVCRSALIEEDEAFGFQDLVDDCEALREALGIEKWSLIGHSVGGYLALSYVNQYPKSVERVIFECPTFDFKLTSKFLLKKTARLLNKYGKPESAKKALELIEQDLSPRDFVESYLPLSDELGEKRMEIYTYNFNNPTDYWAGYTEEEVDELYDRSEVHYNRLREEGKIFENLLPTLKKVKRPMLLMTAEHDAVTCEHHVAAFEKDAEFGEIIHFKECGHTPHYEAADRFADVVKEFLLAAKTL